MPARLMTRSPFVPRTEAARTGLSARLGWRLDRLGQAAAARGLPPGLMGHRWRRHLPAGQEAEAREIHAPRTVTAALPLNVAAAGDLPDEAGWWGFSMRDVPARASGPTRILELDAARVLTAERPDGSGDFAPAILDPEGRSRDLREIRYRPFHAGQVDRPPDLLRDRAVWVAERVFDNYSHWFSAHLPKLVLLRDLGLTDDLVLPAPRPRWMDESLARIGLDPAGITELPRGGTLEARRLVLAETDRFRPELLQAARAAVTDTPATPPTARVFVSRRSAKGRRLLEEGRLAPLLDSHGFEIVEMERLDLAAQIALMARTKVMLAPHGAGLTNMLFCPPGTRIVEIGDPAYPNPNFYAMAAALGHDYAWIAGRGVGQGHPLDHDLSVEEHRVRAALEALP